MQLDQMVAPRAHLGFIGLGYLGSRIARRLAAAGFPLTVWDRDPAKAAQLSAVGARVSSGAAEVARGVDVVLSSLSDDAAVEDVYFGKGKVLENAARGTRIIELSTIAPGTAERLHGAGRAHGIPVLDVAVSGSTPSAESGRLTLFGGGERVDFEVAEPIFRAVAAQWFYMGCGGSGVAMKLVVNTVLGLGMQAVAESLALGSALGLSRDLLFDTLAKTAVVAPAHIGKVASAKRADYTPQFPIRLMQKDFALILSEAARLKLRMPATEAAAPVNTAEAATGGEEDFSAVVRHMEEQLQTSDIFQRRASL
jgi:3-hydroxyisobutyrate dehydrogenase-like beta-hydroxyacid dehydrogenase